MSEPAREIYRRRKADFEALARRLDRQGLWLANARLVLFLAAAGLGVGVWIHKLPDSALWGALASFLAFLIAAVWHDRVIGREERATVRAEINDRGLARHEDRWDQFPRKGERFFAADHPYARDLDIFGSHSLFQLVDATATRAGEDLLGRWLSQPSPIAQLGDRQAAVRELAPQLEFRESLECEGRLLAKEKPDVAPLLAWAEGPPAMPAWACNRWIPLAMPAGTLALYAAGKMKVVPGGLWLAGLALQIGLLLLTAKRVGRLFEALAERGEKIVRYERFFAVIEAAHFQSPRLQALAQQIRASGSPPSVEMARLARAISFLQLRFQPLFHLPVDALMLWDLHFAGALARWQQRVGKNLRGWFEALAELEALGSLAGFAFDNPRATFPALSPDAPKLSAKGLGHPLIPEARRVTNDVALGGPLRALLITGSNMSGKTTLLRTLGVNTVLGLAGAPVVAESMELSALEVRTSMRVSDSLAQGLSFFYAELRRLKMVLDACDGRPVLFLLDEVLQGTNTAERHAASRAILRRLVDRGAIGGIATHDLGLTTLQEETGGHIRNVHFTDQIKDGEMFFDYHLREGVVATTNALALLRKVGIDVDLPAERSTAG